jgi:protein SCO1/2
MTFAPKPPRSGLPLAAVLVVALAAGLGLWAGQRWFATPRAPAVALQSGVLFPQARALPAFALDGGDGRTIDAAALAGRWTLVFLGFTHCPDVCPTTLAQLGAAEKQWATLPEARRPRILFVSADPERDTPQLTADYARHFSPTALGATADAARLEPFVRSLGMVYMKADLGGGEYTIDHSPTIALLDAEAKFAGFIRPPLDPAKVAADLRTLAGG